MDKESRLKEELRLEEAGKNFFKKVELLQRATSLPTKADDRVKPYKKVDAIQLDRIKQAREQIIDEKDFAYADFDRYKEEVLCVEPDELPDDDFRYGMERCLDILDKLIESEE